MLHHILPSIFNNFYWNLSKSLLLLKSILYTQINKAVSPGLQIPNDNRSKQFRSNPTEIQVSQPKRLRPESSLQWKTKTARINQYLFSLIHKFSLYFFIVACNASEKKKLSSLFSLKLHHILPIVYTLTSRFCLYCLFPCNWLVFHSKV